jgi:putative lysine transport system permease protein
MKQIRICILSEELILMRLVKKKITIAVLLMMLSSIFLFPLSVFGAEKEDMANGEFIVGMEAAYPPFNWTQSDDSNGAVLIQGSNQYANGYDVAVAKDLAKTLDKKLVIVKTAWDGLLPALTSGKIDAIVAGMSPTDERKEQIDFSNNYYTSNLVMMVRSDGDFASAKSIDDFTGAKITAQLGTFHYTVIPQIPEVQQQQAMQNFSAMRVALESAIIDGYVTERPEGVTAQKANSHFKMVEFSQDGGFQTSEEDTAIAVGVRKGDPNLAAINEYLNNFSVDEQNALMDKEIGFQPMSDDEHQAWYRQIAAIAMENADLFIRGAGMTLFISLIGTIVGTLIGLLIGVFRTIPESENKFLAFIYRIISFLVTAYIEIFRGTPMIVQAMVLYYGTALAFGLNLDRTIAALLIVSINTGAYMSEIVRGGIFSVDIGQFEAAQAIGMTHRQTMIKVVLPQVIRNILPATGNEFVINIKDTSVLSVISVSELFFQGSTVSQQNFMYFQTFAIICVIYFVLTFTITRILRFVETKLDGPDAYVPISNQMQVE